MGLVSIIDDNSHFKIYCNLTSVGDHGEWFYESKLWSGYDFLWLFD